MPKRGIGDDFERQPGDYRDGETNDSSASNPFAGSNFGGPGVSGRKILNPKRLRGARPVTPKPLPSQPQAQSQPVTANTGGFGFTFGGSSTPASSGGFNFTSQHPEQQTTGFNFGVQQPSTQSTGFSMTSATGNNPFQSGISSPAAVPPSTGFQGSIFNIQPSTPSAQGNFASSFGGFGGQTNTQPVNNIFGNTQTSEAKPLFSFGTANSQSEQPKKDFVFGQPATGFGSGSQSTSAPSSFNFGNDSNMTVEKAAPPVSTPFSFGASNQQTSAPSSLSATTATTRAASPFTFGTSSQSIQNSITPSTSQPEVSQQTSTTIAATTTAPASSLFSFKTTSSGIQNSFAPVKAQTDGTAKTPLFGSIGSTTSATPSIFSSTSTISAPEASGSLFKLSKPNTTSNIFGSTSSQPMTTTTASGPSMFSNNQSSSGQSLNLFSNSSSSATPVTTGSIFGNPATTVNTTQATVGNTEQSTTAPPVTDKPLFSFKPPTSQDNQKAGTDNSAPLFGSSSTMGSAEKIANEAVKAPLFGAPASDSAKEAPKVEQKPLPSFSFDNSKTSSLSSPFKLGSTAQTSAGSSKDTGLFHTATLSGSTSQPQTTGGPLFATSENKDSSKPLFAVNSTGFTSQSGASKPLFTTAANSVPSTFSMFSPTKNASPEKASLSGSDSNLSKPSFVPQISEATDGSTSDEPSVTYPKIQASTKPSIFSKSNYDKESDSVATANPFGFKSAIEISQDVAADKSPVKSASAAQENQVNGVSNPFTASQVPSGAPQHIEIASYALAEESGPVDADTPVVDLDNPPNDPDIPESFVAKWTKLRTGDLPMDEVVDILLHDWVLQIDIPRDVFAGMDMNQEDEITYLWHQNTVDAAWEYHVNEWGNKDRNLLEVYRIVMTLKNAVDRFHKRIWDKSDSLTNPKIFEERNIRKMAKKNIETWENGLKSEIKNLKKRKIDTMRDDPSREKDIANEAKRSKIGEAGKAVPTKEGSQNLHKQPSIEGDTSHDSIGQNKPVVFGASEPKSASSNIFSAGSSSLNQESPSKVNLFAPSKSAAEITSSPQRSKTSQLFASIANKAVESSSADPPPTTSGKSLFDRISRDSNGAPLREISETPSSAVQEAGNESEQDNSKQGESESYDDDDGSEEEDESDEEETIEQDKPTNIFAQSSSAVAEAKEAALSSNRDNTWKPDSPIRFSKDVKESSTNTSQSKPSIGFVPSGGMPKTISSDSTSAFTVSSQNSWKAPDNPFGNFKSLDAKSDAEKKSEHQITSKPKFEMPKPPANSGPTPAFTVSSQDTWKAPSDPFGLFKKASDSSDSEKKTDDQAASKPKFEMPKPPTNLASTSAFTVSSQDTWKAPSNPFGFFKKASDQTTKETSSTAPTLTLTAPSPQRPAQPLFATQPLFASASPETAEAAQGSELNKPLFGSSFASQSSGAESNGKKTQASSLFGASTTVPATSIFAASSTTLAPNKPLFEITKNEASSTATPPISNHWLDFAKGINKPSSPAPSGASVFASLNTSLNPSRASSPAMSAVSTAAGDTDAEHHDDDEAPKEAQLDLGNTNAGEEDEELLQSIKAKAYEFYGIPGEKKEWTVRGVGELRVLKHKNTGKVRAVLRADQSAKVLLNAGLLSAASYTLMSPKRVNFTVATADGIPTRWFIQVGKEDDAKKLSESFEENKTN